MGIYDALCRINKPAMATKGSYGEQLAVAYLQEKQHTILHTNLRIGRREVDIVSQEDSLLIFTEVKTRTSFDFGYPEAAVTPQKQEHIKSVAAAYLQEHPEYKQIRFDVISILLQNGKAVEYHHIEGAFY